jgi:FimV-like protein
MIYLIIKCYWILLLFVAIGSFSLFLSGLYFIFKKSRPIPMLSESYANLLNIAGEDLMATQLDLARAYIETGKQEVAKKMLDGIKAKGNLLEQQEAERLLGLI